MDSNRGRRNQVAGIAVFVAVSIAVPLIAGNVYPFTTAPMFSEQAETYNEFKVQDQFGNSLPLEEWELHLNYDGNPHHVTGGIVPPPTVNRFGEAMSEVDVREHIGDMLSRDDALYAEIGVEQVIWYREGNRLWSKEKIFPLIVVQE